MSIPTRVLLVLPLTFAFAGYFLRLAVKDKVAALKGVEFRRPRLDPEALGDDTPALALLRLVYVNDPLVRLSGHPPKLKTHEGVGGGGDRLDQGLDLWQRHAELAAQFGGKVAHVDPSLVVKVIEKTVESSSSHCRSTEKNEQDCRDEDSLHTDPP